MDKDDLRRLEEAGSTTQIPAGHVLIERGQYGTGLYVILEGTALVEAPEGTKELGPGTLVGERALLSAEGRRTARVRATSDLHVLVVDRSQFDRLCADDSSFADRVAQTAN